MSGGGRRWGAGLLSLVMMAQLGCAARGGVRVQSEPGRLRPTDRLGVVAGEARVPVKRDGFVEAWMQETGRCTREVAVTVAVQTFGVGLAFLPPVCALMTGALPGMTTQFSGGRMRRAIEAQLASDGLHAKLRDEVARAQASGYPAIALSRATPGNPDANLGPEAAPEPEAILEVTVTEVRIRGDGTLSRVSAVARILAATDRRELAREVLTHDATPRRSWPEALDPALTALSAMVVQRMAPAPRVEAAPASPPDVELRTETMERE